MPTWTAEQSDAIYKSGTNIIVSAGAGSGKTAVLTARVIHKLEENIHINQLLILTFTKAAAGEMKERIRKNIKKNPNLKSELALLDTAYITTFDAFSLSIVKKYHYLLNLPSNPKITDETVIEMLRKDILRKTMDDFYEQEDSEFLHFIDTFCVKDDVDVYNNLLRMTKTLEQTFTHNQFLETYFKSFYTKEKKQKWIQEYEQLTLQKKEELYDTLENFSYSAPKDYYEKCLLAVQGFLNAQTLDELITYRSIKLPALPRNSEEELKIEKEKLNDKIKEIQKYLEYGTCTDLEKSLDEMEHYLKPIIRLLQQYFKKFEEKKRAEDIFDFNDIAFLALTILKENPSVLQEIQDSFKEIMVDEYQDTNDIQEEFIKLISNHNVYMVGDIKQSIYRFRNANPYIFKNKYDQYREHQNGEKIDLLKNFRSREEVLKNINQIFNLIMDDALGGANYMEEHQMVFGNQTYITNGTTKENYDMELRYYQPLKDSNFTKEEIEIFTIGMDIKEKIQNQYLLFDKDEEVIRPATYNDFVILMDRTTSFPLYKKIFNYLQIPISLYKDEILSNTEIFYIVKNLIQFLLSYQTKSFDQSFRYAFVSIGRSFLYEKTDEELYQSLKTKSWYDIDIYQQLKPLIEQLNELTLKQIIVELYQLTDIYQKTIKIGNVNENSTILDQIVMLAENYGNDFHDLKDFYDYLARIIEEEFNIRFTNEEESNQSVKIMTIHKSKGLEYPICYFSGLYKTFNIADLKDRFLFDKKIGFVTPLMQEGIASSFLKELIKNNYMEEEISEKLRLFYVAVTRAKEKMILILPEPKKEWRLPQNSGVLSRQTRLKYRSFADFFYSISQYLEFYKKKIDLTKINLSKDYLYQQETIEQTCESGKKINVEELSFENKPVEQKHFSKKNHQLIDTQTYEEMKLGTMFHQALENIDFSHINLDSIESPFLRHKIENFIRSSFFQQYKDQKIYQEYEFCYLKNNQEFHGIIDLLIDTDQEVIILDYKLSDTKDTSYLKQLEGYKTYIETKTKKIVHLYLYSILKENFIPIT